jgi:hypothetical protein
MAHPEGPSDSNRSEGGGAGAKELSPDDFERLASIFRPSWKLDDAPVTAGASFSKDEVQALQGRASSNGIHGTPIVVVEDAPITAPARVSRPHSTIIATPPAPDAQPTVPSLQSQVGAVALPGTRTTTSSWPPRPPADAPPAHAPDAVTVPPAQRPTVPSWTAEGIPPSQRPNVPSWTDDDRSPFSPPAIIPSGPWASTKSAADRTKILRRDPRSRKPMWIGLGAVVVATGIGLWIWTRDSEPPSPAPSAPEVATVVQAPVGPIIPAPTVSAAPSVAAPSASEPPPKQEEAPPTAASASPPPPAVVEPALHPAALPPAPKPTPAPKAAPGPATVSPVAASPAPKPAPRPKPGAQTIVHDVPF